MKPISEAHVARPDLALVEVAAFDYCDGARRPEADCRPVLVHGGRR
ncbi:DUF6207 family protein [Streptomyces sp. NPDC001312]